MKKLFLIFVICTIVLYVIGFCFANEQSSAYNIVEGLPLVLENETSQGLSYINNKNTELQSLIAEQSLNLYKLYSVYYLGSYTANFDGISLKRCLEWDDKVLDSSPLFNNDTYLNYYKLRTSNILKKYEQSEVFDYGAFIKTSRQEFDSYIKAALGDPKQKDQLMILVQEKLADKLLELEPAKRNAKLNEILDLRLPANNSKYTDNLYQFFESRVRLQLLGQMAEYNKQKLEKLTHSVGMVITAGREGKLQLQSKTTDNENETIQIVNVLQGAEEYRALLKLQDLYGKTDYQLVFTDEKDNTYFIEADKALSAIVFNKEGFIHLNLDDILAEEKPSEIKVTDDKQKDTSTETLKSMELLYSSKTKTASEIVKELNRYSMYLELKDSNISNYFTKKFEGEQKNWKSNLEAKLNSFGTGGTADFMVYLKQFAMLDRKPDKQAGERMLIAKFRNSDIQFRQTEECVLWVTDMLYRLKYMK